jgi:type IV pilus assembly protein PilB
MDKSKTAEYGEIVSLLHRLGLVSEAQLRHAERVRSKLTTPTTFLSILKELGVVSDEMVRKALAESHLNLRIGEFLVELGHISSDDLRAAFAIQQEREKELKLGEVLIKYNFIEEKVFNRVLSMQLGFPLVDVNMALVDRTQVARLPIKTLVDYKFLPLKSQGKETLVAFADPLDKKSVDVARRLLGNGVSPAISEKKSIAETLKLLAGLASGKTLSVDNKTVVGVVNAIIISAIENNASDIHLEPFADRLQVRFREDGVLRHHRDFEREIIAPLTSRLKIMCSADIAEKRRHQGGRILFEHEEGHVDIRVSFYVTVHGEKIVMRLLKQKRELIDIRTVGIAPKMLTRFLEDAVYPPTGVLLVTGPTGSGKTSTVYSCINHIKNPQISIITAEEPVEYFIDGVAQCSIDPSINLTFEETLRHIVRQDPDVIVIGEIRDNVSAEMAMQAALTAIRFSVPFIPRTASVA